MTSGPLHASTKNIPGRIIVPACSYRAVKLPSAHYLLVDCLLFGLSAASNKRNSMRCPESPPTCVWSPTKPPSGSFYLLAPAV
jgi:hypothetical protein